LLKILLLKGTCEGSNALSTAVAADKKFHPLVRAAQQHSDTVHFVLQSLQVLPTLSSTVSKLKNDIDFVCTRIEMLENVLTQQLEDIAQSHYLHFRGFHQRQTQRYADVRRQELISLEKDLKSSLAKRSQQEFELEKLRIQQRIEEQKMRAKEREREDHLREQQLLLEREKNLTEMRERLEKDFQRDLRLYQLGGPAASQFRKSLELQPTPMARSLSDVDLKVEDTQELQSFLISQQPTSSSDANTSEQLSPGSSRSEPPTLPRSSSDLPISIDPPLPAADSPSS